MASLEIPRQESFEHHLVQKIENEMPICSLTVKKEYEKDIISFLV